MKVAGDIRIERLVACSKKFSMITRSERKKKTTSIEVVFVQPYASDVVDYLRPYFLLKRSTRPSA